ncbi:type I-E CRISPR-associated protein Cas7/Cse4/CasC [Peptoniphilus senegalensis]|uniref:type I-E CRISPR-associated protein Cas7/Cse4/CasC n=1 Tax=Peptoniphilus senegalensis TaxID=1465757 RepID=UPI0003082851|nr:type I-E CRISPR-associated protein Cas7/Cse4/CasC [Peptoniphilus senegalensis]
MKKNNLYLDINVIQTLPPSNVNRDDTGSPKTAQYGGVRRARVSSQSWKRAIRKYFNEKCENSNLGIRSYKIPEYVVSKIREIDNNLSEEEALKMAEDVLNNAGVKIEKHKTKALFFIGKNQAENLARAAVNKVKDKKLLRDILKDDLTIDIALFGRMLANDSILTEDASCQVAHAISTHAVETEFDFFTALDDLQKDDENGAGMLETIEYNSSTLYRYANVAVHEFVRQLSDKEETINALKLFVEAFAKSLPTGKVNTFANTTIPSFIIVTLREDRPVNLVSAFENPVKAYKNKGFVEESVEKLLKEYKKSEKFVEEPLATFCLSLNEFNSIDGIKVEDNFKALLKDLEEKLGEIIPDELGE